MAWALQKSKDILKKMTQKHAQNYDSNKEPLLKMFALDPLFWKLRKMVQTTYKRNSTGQYSMQQGGQGV